MLRLALLLILLPCLAFAQGKEQLPTGIQYLQGRVAEEVGKVAQMLDAIAERDRRIEALQKMLDDKPKEPQPKK